MVSTAPSYRPNDHHERGVELVLGQPGNEPQQGADDENHGAARKHFDGLGRMAMLTTTSCVPDEVVTSFNVRGRHDKAVEVRERLLGSPSVGMVHVGEDLLTRGFGLLRDRPDKRYSLTDCVSFMLMRERGISVAFAFDRHFEQEGFMREPPTE